MKLHHLVLLLCVFVILLAIAPLHLALAEPMAGASALSELIGVLLPLQGCGLLWDVNNDGAVDVNDLAEVADRWRTSEANPNPDGVPSTPNYEDKYDVDGDKDIDIVDLMLVAGYWGETCPALDVQSIVQGLLALGDPSTRIPPSHWGTPDFENLTYLYDATVIAMIFKAAGRQVEAEALLDYLDARIRVPLETVQGNADTNRVYGIVKLFEAVDPSAGEPETVHAPLNGFDRTSTTPEGRSLGEIFTTPGPTSFVLYAMMQVNQTRYARSIEVLETALRAMQAADGGVRDGDRMPDTVHTEPHVDAASALLMASGHPLETTPWPGPAEAAWQWFRTYVLDAEAGVIHQGYRPDGPSTIFATDCYSWTMAGPFGDRIMQEFGLEALKKLSLTMLHRGLVPVAWTKPDGTVEQALLLDFTDPAGPEVMRPVVDNWTHPDYGVTRGGYHPVGSSEWTGGAILGLEKNAVRAWEAGNPELAGWFKALAVALKGEVIKTYYTVKGVTISEYATGHDVATGHGWRTPIAYVRRPDGTVEVQGGSAVGGWPVLPAQGVNPFILNDGYRTTYDQILMTNLEGEPVEVDGARALLEGELRHPPFTEEPLTEMPTPPPIIRDPGEFNHKMFEAFNRGDYQEAIQWWAEQVVLWKPDWVLLAQRDQDLKREELGGIVNYPWGTRPTLVPWLERAIWHYPLLNEVGASMWGLAASHFELGHHEDTKHWMRRMITEVPYHQIYDPSGPGYWNAFISWNRNPGNVPRDAAMMPLYRQVLQDLVDEFGENYLREELGLEVWMVGGEWYAEPPAVSIQPLHRAVLEGVSRWFTTLASLVPRFTPFQTEYHPDRRGAEESSIHWRQFMIPAVDGGSSMTFDRAAGNRTIEMIAGRVPHQPPEIDLKSISGWETATRSGYSSESVPH